MSAVPSQAEPRPPHRSRVWATLKRLVRTRITAGIFTILPLLITFWVVKLIFLWMRDASRWVVKAFLVSDKQLRPAGDAWLDRLGYDWEKWQMWQERGLLHQDQFYELMPWHVQWAIAILSVALTIFLLYLVGLLAANLFGRRVIEFVEQLLDRVPLIKTVYRGLKQVFSSFAGDQTQSFQRVALVPFPQEKMRCVAFVTNVFIDSVTNEELCAVFIPTTPNPTTGYLQIMKRAEITELNWTVEDGIRVIMSGGILKPGFLTMLSNKQLPPDVVQTGGEIASPPPAPLATDGVQPPPA